MMIFVSKKDTSLKGKHLQSSLPLFLDFRAFFELRTLDLPPRAETDLGKFNYKQSLLLLSS